MKIKAFLLFLFGFAIFLITSVIFSFTPAVPTAQAADPCRLALASDTRLGQQITLSLSNYVESNFYAIVLFRNNVSIAKVTIDPFNYGDPLFYKWPGITSSGTYAFKAYLSDSSARLVNVCQANPAQFTLGGSLSGPECSDGIDNDRDGKTDFDFISGAGDPNCSTPLDESESPDAPQCSDRRDNDNDGLIDDFADPDCTDQNDNSEGDASVKPECSDGKDNDGDGKIDFDFIAGAGDPGCTTPLDNNEDDPIPDPDPQPGHGLQAQCTLAARPFYEGQDVSFTLDNLTPGATYVVVLYAFDRGFPKGKLSKTFIGPDPTAPISSSFPSDGIVKFPGISYSIKAFVGDENGPICAEGEVIELVSGKNPCEGGTCNTALGNISTSIGPFAEKILAIGIGIAGGIALIIMVIGSIRILTSGGDPKNVAAGREMIIAAVAGLLFLIFSVLILRWIGVFIVGF